MTPIFTRNFTQAIRYFNSFSIPIDDIIDSVTESNRGKTASKGDDPVDIIQKDIESRVRGHLKETKWVAAKKGFVIDMQTCIHFENLAHMVDRYCASMGDGATYGNVYRFLRDYRQMEIETQKVEMTTKPELVRK